MPLAFFDLDRTLLSVNAGRLWVRAELRAGNLTRWQAARAAAWIFGYHLGYARMERILEEGVATLAGQEEDELRARTRLFYEREIAPTFRRRARAVVEAHRAAGHVLVLLSSTTPYLAEPVCEALGIEHVLCNRFEVVDGRFTGRPLPPLCFGPGKLVHAESLAGSLGERLTDATFYTDSASDLPVLERVGRPVAVHPDPRLSRIAQRRGWQIDDWEHERPPGAAGREPPGPG